MSDFDAKIAQLQGLRSSFGDAWVDQRIVELRAEHAAQQRMEADGGVIAGSSQRTPLTRRVAQRMVARDSGQIVRSHQISGDNNTINEAPPDPAAVRAERALRDYLTSLQTACSPLQLARIDEGEARFIRPMRLEQVYVTLNTTTQMPVVPSEEHLRSPQAREKQTRALTALEALCSPVRRDGEPHRVRLMLLGAPGGGKSTFVNHLALCLASTALAALGVDEVSTAEAWLARLPGWSYGVRLPVRVVLRELAAFPELTRARQGSLDLLLAYLRTSLGEAAEALDPLRDALTDGRAILLFDGLDEVVGEPALSRVVETIAAATGTYARCPALVTCRVRDYHDNRRRQIHGFFTETLAELSDEQVQQFVEAWYAEQQETGRQALGSAAALQQAIETRGELRALARSPLLLTMMAVVHAGKGTLPDARALLYAECVNLLLLRWRHDPGGPDMLEQLGVPQFRSGDLLALMARLGYAAHEQASRDPNQAERPADLSRSQVQAILASAFEPYTPGDEPRREQLVSTVLHTFAGRNGLLLKQSGEQGESYAFPHRTFQEFLAGYHLKGQREYRKLCLERAAQPHWHEVLALMVGFQVLSDRELERPLNLVEGLLARSPNERALAGDLLNLIGRERALGYDPALLAKDGLWARARSALLEASTRATTPDAPAALRVRVGLVLGTLQYGKLAALFGGAKPPVPDVRLPLAVVGLVSPDAVNWLRALDTYWRPVEAGLFWHHNYESEQPWRQVELPYRFWIGRFPITNADYARFVAVGGYNTRSWWTPRGLGWREQEGRRQPRNVDWLSCNNPLQPVVGVSWYEAAAYCAWLTAQGHAQGWLPQSELLRLPTALEWERAAHGVDQRRYPWGDDMPTREHANLAETGIHMPSPVGCFPLDLSPDGVSDMVGNVTEWLATTHARVDAMVPWKDLAARRIALLSAGSCECEEEKVHRGIYTTLDPGSWQEDSSFRVVRSRALGE